MLPGLWLQLEILHPVAGSKTPSRGRFPSQLPLWAPANRGPKGWSKRTYSGMDLFEDTEEMKICDHFSFHSHWQKIAIRRRRFNSGDTSIDFCFPIELAATLCQLSASGLATCHFLEEEGRFLKD